MGSPQPDAAWQEGDRCTGCGHWRWAGPRGQEGWHSLVPVAYADHPEMARPVQCGVCPQTQGRAGVWVGPA